MLCASFRYAIYEDVAATNLSLATIYIMKRTSGQYMSSDLISI